MGGRGFSIGASARGACCAALLACAVPALAQPEAHAETVRFHTYGTAEGLSQATSHAIAQDRNGFIWVGTQDGLNRFDGYAFKAYKHTRGDPYSLSQNHVWALADDPDGSLWVGTQAGGLNRHVHAV